MIVDLLPGEQQTLIVDSVKTLLARVLPVERLHVEENRGGAFERARWPEIVGLGLVGLGLSADDCGVGYTLVEEALCARELGRNLVSTTVIATMAAAHIAAALGRRELVQSLVNGDSRAACANALGRIDGDTLDVQLLDAEGADHALVWDREAALLLPLTGAPRRRIAALDDAVALDRASLPLANAIRSDRRVVNRISLLLAAYQVGIAGATRDRGVEYAKAREQFGQPIGAFQAIKHACADMAVREEAAYAQVFFSSVTEQRPGGASSADVPSARLLADQAAIDNAKANVQIHGAMGFTFECDAHFFLKRANLLAVLNGGRRNHQADILG